MKIGLVELPAIRLVDGEGKNWTAFRRREPLVSKQILLPQLRAGGYEVTLVNLKDGDDELEYGQVQWRGLTLHKVLVGRRHTELDPADFDLWGVTINYLQERDAATLLIRHLVRGGARVVAGGSDVFGNPEPYLEAGASAVILDKSGAANLPVLDFLLGKEPRAPLCGVRLADGRQFPNNVPPMDPTDWPVPTPDVVEQCLGHEYWEGTLPDELLPIGSAMVDLGCDRKCDFCQTPKYKVGYRRMSPEHALRWFAAQKEAGARSVICPSDQFLGRVLWKEGRQEVLEIMQGVRDLGLPVLWGNGLEMKKTTVGRGFPNSDPTPDEELIHSLWGWNGESGCFQAYLPAERPTAGRESYAKLLPWKEHCALMRAIVRTGIPDLTYGVIVGLPDDSHETLEELERAIVELSADLKSINPALSFRVSPFAIRPLPGTSQDQFLRQSGLLRFEDPAIVGGFWTACADTHHLGYEEVSDWQSRLAAAADVEPRWQGITGVIREQSRRATA
jgi:hypothetical protein